MRHLHFYVLILLAVLFTGVASERVDSAKSKAESERDRLMQQARRRNPRPEYDIDYRFAAESNSDETWKQYRRTSTPTAPVLTDGLVSTTATPPPPSPGLAIGQSYWDFQHIGSSGHQVARLPGSDIVHFIWLSFDRLMCGGVDECVFPFAAYNSYTVSSGLLNQGFGGAFVSLGTQTGSGAPAIAIDQANRAHAAFHQPEQPGAEKQPWRLYFSTVGSVLHTNEDLSGVSNCPEVMWPQLAVSRDGTQTAHIIAHTNGDACSDDILWYWRYNGVAWTGPVVIDSTSEISYVIADDPGSQSVAVAVAVSNHPAMNGLNNIAYIESATDGAGWISGTEPISKAILTNYSDLDGPQAWLHITSSYDNAGTLHIVWDEQRFANQSAETAIRHWSNLRQTIRTVAIGYWDTPYSTGVYNLNLAKITLGIGDGGTTCLGQPNDDNLYVLYTRFGGPTPQEQADVSALGYANGELYLNVSGDGGASWSRPANLTNSKTPACYPGPADTVSGIPLHTDSVCRSEHWASIGQTVSDIDIFFVSDADAGSAIHGEGYANLNPIMYLRLPGGAPNSQYLCPESVPNLAVVLTSTVQCEYHAAPGEIKSDETLTVMNIGSETLSGSVAVIDAPWLTVVGGGGFALTPGSNDLVLPLTMNATSLGEGLYSGTIRITHNDSAQPNPYDIPIDFFVIADFNCAQSTVISTGVE